MALSANEAEAWWPHSGESGSLQAAYFLTTGLRPSRKTSGILNVTSNISGFLAWTPLGLFLRPQCLPNPRLVCPGHLGKHLGTTGRPRLTAHTSGWWHPTI